MKTSLKFGLSLCTSGLLIVFAIGADAREKKEKISDRNRLIITRDVVVATKSEKPISELPYMAWFQDDTDMVLAKQAKLFTESLKYIPGVMLQKTGNGMTSPHLRGMTGQRVALFADGVRLNNAFLREGPNQYWNLVDHFFYDETEVLFGPAGVLYGSDAIGGTVLANSSAMERGQSGAGAQWLGGTFIFRGASSERSVSEHLQGTMAGDDDVTIKFGLTRQDFGDLRSGNTVDNEQSDFEQWSGNLRVRYWLDSDNSVLFGFDKFDQDDVDRTHRTMYHEDFNGTSTKGSTSDLARIYDHDREMVFARFESREGRGVFEDIDLGLSYQNFTENYRRIRGPVRQERRFTRVETLGFNVRTLSDAGFGKLTWGLDYYHDSINSSGQNIAADGTVTQRAQGVVADDATYDLTNAYVQMENALTDSVDLITGINYTYADMDAGTVDFGGGSIQSLRGNWDSVTGNARLIYKMIDNKFNVFTGISQGFRAPNISDTTRDDEFGGGTEAPTANLDEERFTTYEAGFKSFGDWGYLTGAYYYTHIKDRIARLRNTGTGNDTKANLDDGHIHGAELNLRYNVTDSVSVRGGLTWQEGEEWTYFNRDITSSSVDRPVSRMSPLTGNCYLRWQQLGTTCWVECGIDWADNQSRLADAELADNRFPPGGTPSYEVFNIRSGWAVTPAVDLALALENITDQEYRIHGSGMNEPGRNLVMTVLYKF